MLKLDKWKRLGILAIATGGFVGFFPVASGTFGSALASGLLWICAPHNETLPLVFHLVLIVALCLIGVWASDHAGKILKKADASPIVIDEIVGILITMVGIPLTSYWVVWGFLVFRFFDILKVPPIDWFDRRFKNGWGVMLDDVMAGVFANVVLRLMLKAQY